MAKKADVVYRWTGSPLTRTEGGVETIISKGEEFEPTEVELRSFPDRIKMIEVRSGATEVAQTVAQANAAEAAAVAHAAAAEADERNLKAQAEEAKAADDKNDDKTTGKPKARA